MSKIIVIAVAVMLTVVAFAAAMPTVRAQEEEKEIPKLMGNEKWNETLFYLGMGTPIIRWAVMILCLLSGYQFGLKEWLPLIGWLPYAKLWIGAVLDVLKAILNIGKGVIGR